MGVQHTYYLDFLVRLTAAMTVVLEIKGYEDDQDKAKHQAPSSHALGSRGQQLGGVR